MTNAKHVTVKCRDLKPGLLARGLDGNILTLADLPAPNTTQRWVIRLKALVVAGVRGGLLSLEEACRMYTLTADEFSLWERAVDRDGIKGLRVTKIQKYRRLHQRQAA